MKKYIINNKKKQKQKQKQKNNNKANSHHALNRI